MSGRAFDLCLDLLGGRLLQQRDNKNIKWGRNEAWRARIYILHTGNRLPASRYTVEDLWLTVVSRGDCTKTTQNCIYKRFLHKHKPDFKHQTPLKIGLLSFFD